MWGRVSWGRRWPRWGHWRRTRLIWLWATIFFSMRVIGWRFPSPLSRILDTYSMLLWCNSTLELNYPQIHKPTSISIFTQTQMNESEVKWTVVTSLKKREGSSFGTLDCIARKYPWISTLKGEIWWLWPNIANWIPETISNRLSIDKPTISSKAGIKDKP